MPRWYGCLQAHRVAGPCSWLAPFCACRQLSAPPGSSTQHALHVELRCPALPALPHTAHPSRHPLPARPADRAADCCEAALADRQPARAAAIALAALSLASRLRFGCGASAAPYAAAAMRCKQALKAAYDAGADITQEVRGFAGVAGKLLVSLDLQYFVRTTALPEVQPLMSGSHLSLLHSNLEAASRYGASSRKGACCMRLRAALCSPRRLPCLHGGRSAPRPPPPRGAPAPQRSLFPSPQHCYRTLCSSTTPVPAPRPGCG